MSKTGISYVDEVWNPMVGCGCGCEYCYAGELHEMRHKALLAGKQVPKQYAKPFETVQLFPERLDVPLRRRKPTVFFVNSMGDLFDPQVPDEFRDQVYAVMALCPQHTFLVLTKQAGRMAEYCCLMAAGKRKIASSATEMLGSVVGGVVATRMLTVLKNVYHGVTCEDQQLADERIPHLLRVPGRRFLSLEPLLGPVDLSSYLLDSDGWYCQECDRDVAPAAVTYQETHDARCEGGCGQPVGPFPPNIHACLLGGETGKNARPMKPQWARDVRDQCAAAGVPYFHKQNGNWRQLEGSGAGHPTPIGFFCPDPGPCHDKEFTEGITTAKNHQHVVRVGKKKAGRLLDGQLHDDLPWVK